MLLEPFRIDFLLIPKFSMMALVSAMEPLRVANRVLAWNCYSWRFVSQNGEAVVASNDMSQNCVAIPDPEDLSEAVFVNASYDPDRVIMPQTLAWLRRSDRHGKMLGAMDTGAFFLAAAGLLEDKNATVHWEAIPWFNAKFPRTNFVPQIFVYEGRRMVCAGGTSSLDMSLALIREHHGEEISTEVASQLISPGIRENSERQNFGPLKGLSYVPPQLHEACILIDENLSAPLPGEEIAEAVELSRRSLEGLFKKHMGVSMSKYSLQKRLTEARRLIRGSDLKIEDIAHNCGFASAAHFTRAYRKQFFVVPSGERE